MPIYTPNATQLPVKIAGSSVFGRYPMISGERTYNMFLSDNWLISFAGYRLGKQLVDTHLEGRGLYYSTRGSCLIAIVNQFIFKIDQSLTIFNVGTLLTNTGEVSIDENLSSQVCIVDGVNAYIFNLNTNNTLKAVFSDGDNFVPNYVAYHNTFFLFGNGNLDASGNAWYIYKSGYTGAPGTEYNLTFVQQLALQTKPDFAKAVIRIPSQGNNVLVLGSTVCEIWSQVGGISVYQRNSSINIDFGVASVATIAANEELVAWLGINEKSGPAIMVMSGGPAQRISTDGIDYLLSKVRFPGESTAMFYRQDGHLFYILTFLNEADNFTIMWDATTKQFYDLTDWDFTHHPARQICYFNGTVYFISQKQGNLMILDSDITDMSTDALHVYEIPRIRITDTVRFPGSDRYIVNRFSFTIENGVEQGVNGIAECEGFLIGESSDQIIFAEDGVTPILGEQGFCQTYRPRIDVSFSKNGAYTFGNQIPYYMHNTAQYKNQPIFNSLGEANQITCQMKFEGFGRVCVYDGVYEVYQ